MRCFSAVAELLGLYLMTMLLELKMNQVEQHQQQQQASSTLLYNAAGQPVAITLPPPAVDYELYKSIQSKIVGVILIIVGILSIILNAVGIGLHEVGTFLGHGFWCGVMVSKLRYSVTICEFLT